MSEGSNADAMSGISLDCAQVENRSSHSRQVYGLEEGAGVWFRTSNKTFISYHNAPRN